MKTPKDTNSAQQAAKKFVFNQKTIIAIISIGLVACVTLVAVLGACGVFSGGGSGMGIADMFKILSVEPTKTVDGFAAVDTGFMVYAENADTDLVREHLFISGGPDYTVQPRSSDAYEVVINNQLAPGKNVKLQFVKDGAVLNSWAFDTEEKLDVADHYPYDDAYGVEKNSVIEIEMTLSPTEDIKDFVQISPPVNGKWEKIGRVFRFTPDTFLATDADYVVKVTAGMTSENLTMETDYTFGFHTYSYEKRLLEARPITMDGVEYYRPNEEITITYQTYRDTMIEKVNIKKFRNAEDMIAYANGNTTVATTQFSSPTLKQSDRNNRISFDGLPEGYYLAQLYAEGRVALSQVFQVNAINAYAGVSGTDILVWLESSGVPVKYKDSSLVTDENGLALFKDVFTDTRKMEYVYIGEGATPLVIAVQDLTDQYYPNCYIYSDKPKYKTTDTIKVWGCLPMDLFHQTKPSFSVELYCDGTAVESIGISPDENGTFTASIPYSNLAVDEYAHIYLNGDDRLLASKYIDIDDYELQNYSYYCDADTNYVWGGNTYSFNVTVQHVSGAIVSNKRVRASYNGTDYYATTDQNGIAHFSIAIPKLRGDAFEQELRLRPVIEPREIHIYNGDVEEEGATEPTTSLTFYLLKSRQNAWAFYSGDKLTMETRLVDTTDISTVVRNASSYNIERGSFDTTGTTTIFLTTKTRSRVGEKYDAYTNTYQPTYSQTSRERTVVHSENYTTKNGKWEYDFSSFTIPESTEFTCYQLQAVTTIDLTCDGEIVRLISDRYLDGNSFATANAAEEEGYFHNVYSEDSNRFINSQAYGMYAYSLAREKDFYAVGDTVALTLQSSYSDYAPKNGKVLRILYDDSIKETKLFSDRDDLSFTFTEEYVPGINVTCAYLLDGKFHRMPSEKITADEEQRTILIETKTDKEEYAPGEQVTVTVKTTKQDGTPISCAVNLSAVNEAVFGGAEEYLPLGEDLMNAGRSLYSLYTVSTYRDYRLWFDGGGKGGSGEEDIRKNFVDTACFHSTVTDQNGAATITFTVPDSITTYRMTVHAANPSHYYGTHVNTFSVTSDFFLQSTAPRGLKNTDDFVANANTLSATPGSVNFEFEIVETAQKMTATAPTGSNAAVNFGKLPVGTYTMRVTAKCGELKDAVEYPFEVVIGSMTDSVQQALDTTTTTVIRPTAFPVSVDVYTELTGQYLNYLDYLQSNSTDRLDMKLASHLSYALQNELFGESIPTGTLHDLSEYFTENGVARMFTSGSPDLILNAFGEYYHMFDKQVNARYMHAAKTPREAAERLLLEAAEGEGVLHDLQALESATDSNDSYTKIVISLAYAFAGDYENAKRVYDTCDSTYTDRGYQALCATVASFVDTNHAREMLNTLLETNAGDYYLPFAVIAFMKNRAVYDAATTEVTVYANDTTQNFALGWLEVKTLVFTDDGKGELHLSFNSQNAIAATARYQDYDNAPPTNAFSVTLTGAKQKYDTAVLEINISSFARQSNRIDIVLPPGLRAASARKLKGGALLSAKHEQLTVHTSKETNTIIRIPLVVTNEGEYLLESVRLTDSHGKQHYSAPIQFKVNK